MRHGVALPRERLGTLRGRGVRGSRLATLALLAALGGCAGEGTDQQADEAAVRELLAKALAALYDGDGARACALYTRSYRRALVEENRADTSELAPKARSCEGQVREFAPVLTRFVPERDVKVIRVSVSGERASALSEFNTTRGRTRIREFLVRRGGRWRIDADQEPGEPPPARR